VWFRLMLSMVRYSLFLIYEGMGDDVVEVDGAMADDELDALTGLGHACGHNLIAVASVGAALAAAEVMVERGLGGKVVLFGTPAEGENPFTKVRSRRLTLSLQREVAARFVSSMLEHILITRWISL